MKRKNIYKKEKQTTKFIFEMLSLDNKLGKKHLVFSKERLF
jgi:hypothetical protein